MFTNEILVTNERLSEIDKLILMNINSILKLIDLQKKLLNEVEEQTEDKMMLNQVGDQLQNLKDCRIMFALLGKLTINELSQQEKEIFWNLLR